MKLLITQFSP